MIRDAEDLGRLVRGDEVGVGVEAGVVGCFRGGAAGALLATGCWDGFARVGLGRGEGFGGQGVLFAGVGGKLDG